ncbi:MAG: MBL fold metallo-hydrolase [bacterium]|nr:MBL fold metallo-hydrolase [bacterium]
MKVQVIGSGCMNTKYNSACYLIDNEIMIDFPNGACKYLYKLNINPIFIEDILLTHFHGDHYFDIPFCILGKIKEGNKKLNIYCSKEGKSKIKKLNNLAFPNSFSNLHKKINIKYIFNNSFKIKNYYVDKILVNHGKIKPSFGYVFKYKNNYIGFTGDSSLCENIENMAKKCSYLFCDCTLLIGNNQHLGVDNIKCLSEKYPECIFVVSHLEDESREKLINLKISNVIIPNDGQTIIVDKYI